MMKKDYSRLNLRLVLSIKKLKELENALKYELAKNKAMIENSGDCIKILDKKGNIMYMNLGGLKEHNFRTHKEAIGWDWMSSLEEPYRRKARKALNGALNGMISAIDVKHTHQGSNREWCSMIVTPIKDERNNVMQILAISRDITEQKRREQRFKTKIRVLKERLKSVKENERSDFLSRNK